MFPGLRTHCSKDVAPAIRTSETSSKAYGYANLPDGRRPVSNGMRYAPDDRRAQRRKRKETGGEKD
jgi:hypothetical protein